MEMEPNDTLETPYYGMFGTGRKIKKYTLEILEIKKIKSLCQSGEI